MAENTAMSDNSMDLSMATGPAEYPEDEWLALSGIQHFEFCKRQWALIHIEEQWRDNTRTYAGDFEHRRAHDYHASEKRGDTLILRDLRVFSRKLGVVGDCDIVEFHAAQDGVSLIGRRGRWKPYPVEYKHGSSKVNNADRLQLCGEAMCLEEMLSCSISQGALFYQRTKRRELVELNDDLRAQVVHDLAQMRDLYRRGHTPKVKPKTGCRSCSLKDICLPELVHKSSAAGYIRKTLKEL
ncbi:CRISPR-associated protein Cas4 [Bifidobacterium polysaccharolyticum]